VSSTFGIVTNGPEWVTNAHLLEEAQQHAIDLFNAACEKAGITHGGIARIEVMEERYADLELEKEPEVYLGLAEVAVMLGVSKQRVSELRSRPDFPSPIAELASGPVWARSSLARFVSEWPRKPGRPPKVP
jgi:hypothetical protein